MSGRGRAGEPADAGERVKWTVKSILVWTREHFEKKQIGAARLTAEVLLAHALGCDRVKLYMDFDRPLDKSELARFRALIERRLAGEPTQYIVGVREFYGRPFQCDKRAFIPRPETEMLCALALDAIPRDKALRALDLCTGAGAVAVTLAAERPGISVDATELSPAAAELARENAERFAPGRVTVYVGDLFLPLPPDRRYPVITANPPYIAERENLSNEILDHEPHLALFGGPEGMDVIRRLAAAAPGRLEPGGLLVMELDELRGEITADTLRSAGLSDVDVHQDLGGLDRFVTARLR